MLSTEELILFTCGVGGDSWEPLGLQGDQTSQSTGLIGRKSTLCIHWKDWCWRWSSNILATWCEELTHWKRPWCWERLRAGGEGDDRGWDGWMSPPIQRTLVWASSGRQWRTGKPGMLQFTGWQRIAHNWAMNNKMQWKVLDYEVYCYIVCFIQSMCIKLNFLNPEIFQD